MVLSRDTNGAPKRSPSALVVIGGVVSVLGTLVFVASAVMMSCLWVLLLFRSMSWLGVVLGVTTAPLAAAYPFLHWAARGEFPVLYFVIWLSGLIGMAASMTWAAYGPQRASRRVDPVAANVVELRVEDAGAD